MIRINKKCLEFENSKILFSIIQSRHSKATKYRVYCKYNPSIESADSIEWWYCTCKSGEGLVVCCTHVATIIYRVAKNVCISVISSQWLSYWQSQSGLQLSSSHSESSHWHRQLGFNDKTFNIQIDLALFQSFLLICWTISIISVWNWISLNNIQKVTINNRRNPKSEQKIIGCACVHQRYFQFRIIFAYKSATPTG